MQTLDDTQAGWIKEQLELKTRLVLHDEFFWSVPAKDVKGSEPLKLVGGVDISFVKENNEDACASLIVLDYPSLKVIYERFEMVKLTLPYIPGFLAFREVPFLKYLVDDLRDHHPELVPQVIFVDGNGILHPQGFGLASHLGVLTGIPTIGIAKTFFNVDGLTVKGVKKSVAERCQQGGDFVELVGASGFVWGAAVRSHDESTNAIFVSQGHLISLPTALSLVRGCSLYRVPEPVRQADLRSRAYLREHPIS